MNLKGGKKKDRINEENPMRYPIFLNVISSRGGSHDIQVVPN